MTTIIEHPQQSATFTTFNGIERQHKNEAARQLLREWREDESGTDEESYPKVKQLIEENRLSARSSSD